MTIKSVFTTAAALSIMAVTATSAFAQGRNGQNAPCDPAVNPSCLNLPNTAPGVELQGVLPYALGAVGVLAAVAVISGSNSTTSTTD